jgi:hypothetical protein
VWHDRGGHFDGVTQLRTADKTKSALFREKRDFSFSEFNHFSVRRALKENRIFVNQSWDQRSDAAHREALIDVPKTCSVRPLSGSKTSSRAQDAIAKYRMFESFSALRDAEVSKANETLFANYCESSVWRRLLENCAEFKKAVVVVLCFS